MKSIFHSFLVTTLILFACNLGSSQDSKRIGGYIGYFNGITNSNVNSLSNRSNHRCIGFNYMTRYTRYTSFETNLEVNLADVMMEKQTFGSGASTGKAAIISLVVGIKANRTWHENLTSRYGLIFEYDFYRPDNNGYIYQNGFGGYVGIEYDLRLSETLVLSIGPEIRLRNFLAFQKTPNNPRSILPPDPIQFPFAASIGGKVGLAYSIF